MNHTRIGLVRCDHCGRQFNPHSGARHIPWCAKQQANSRRHKISADKLDALERYKWRINYRPSNQMNGGNHQPPRQLNLADFSRRAKKSSVNSSATLSSPGSTASTGTNSASSNHNHNNNNSNSNSNNNYQPNGRQTPANRNYQQLPRSQPPVQVSQLKRSVSSHTLTKQRGTISSTNNRPPVRNNADTVSISSYQSQQDANDIVPLRQRTKSVNDLSRNMSEIVETLAKRMEEIYAQNQILLTKFASNKADSSSNKTSATADDASDTNSENLVRCHHCKSSCTDESNYCHNCGCKLHASSRASTPG